jgi:hypothetical protein
MPARKAIRTDIERWKQGDANTASEKVIDMTVEKESRYSQEQLQGMEDRECWRWIYTHFPSKSRRPEPSTCEICFTGYRILTA